MNYKLLTALTTLSLSAPANASIVLTEINLTTGQIELTNTSASLFSGTELEWCRPFNYGVLETGGFSFAAGETRVYTMSVSGLTADDVWIYLNRTGGFGDESAVTTGIVFGSDQSAAGGRVNAVVADTGGAAWAVNTDFVSTAGITAGQTLQLNAGAPASNSSANWSIGAANLGTYAVPEPSSTALLGLAGVSLLLRRRR